MTNERCPYCDADVFSVALHIAVCPACTENVSDEEREIVATLERELEKAITPPVPKKARRKRA